MKKHILVFVALLASAIACDDFLELQPESQINDQNFYKTENDFEKAMIGVYSTFKDVYNTNIFYIAELMSDNAEISISSSSVTEMEFDEANVTSSNTILQSIWSNLFYTIARSNVVIKRLEGSSINPDVRSRIEGEARFMRAYSYFLVVQIFGKAPLTDAEFRSPEQIASADLSLKPADVVFAEIINDLLKAETLLPEAVNPDKGRASRGTAKTLLAKVYLTRGADQDAAVKLQEVIQSGDYALLDSYKQLFSTANENLAEAIFELKFISGANLGNSYSVQFTPATSGLLANGQQGSGRITPALSLANAFEEDDVRRSATLGDSITSGLSGERTYSRHGLKFVELTATNPRDGSINFTLLRYADVLLMLAESLNNLGETEEALNWVNVIRTRAGLDGYQELTQDELREVIAQERRVEFAFEGQRWFDLVRTGRAQEVVNAFYAAKGLSFSLTEAELTFPIPRREIEINPALE